MITLNGQPLSVTIFPDNTSQVWKISEDVLLNEDYADIVWDFRHEGEVMHLAQLAHLLSHVSIHKTLTIKYLPYGRQDKVVANDATFALRTFAKILNAMNFDEIVIHDPHSSVALWLIDNSVAVYPIAQVEQIAQEMGEGTVFCYPDKGAVEKYTEVYKLCFRDHVYGEKVRDQLTGNILSYKLVGDVAGKNVLIVDDICDGGMTFKMLAKDLLAAGAKEVNLFVTHGIFSKGVRTLLESGIKRVFTQDGEKGPRSQTVQL